MLLAPGTILIAALPYYARFDYCRTARHNHQWQAIFFSAFFYSTQHPDCIKLPAF